MNNQETIDYIREHVTPGDRLAQVAEEACELAQAVLKLKRAYEDRNPTNISMDDAYDNVMEEWADLTVACTVAFGSGDDVVFPNHPWNLRQIAEMTWHKLERWATRLTLHKRGDHK